LCNLHGGACVKNHGGEVDGCQLFYPDEANARKCGACQCHRSLHKPPPSMSPSCLHKVTQNSVANTVLSSQGDIMLIDDDECLNGPLSKKLKVNDIVPNGNV